jgi:pimeloyl-ACP methyl ester carboxylesterase
MQFIEYGKENTDTILLLHGGGLNWWNYRDEAEILQSRYHVILPVLDGHAGSDRPFTSIEDNASEIISFLDERFGGRVLLIGGLSLGAQILLEMLAQKKDICRYAMIESASVIPSRVTNLLIGPSFGSSYGLIRQKWFSRLQFRSLRIRQDLFEDYYRDTCAIMKQDLIAFMKANTAYSLKEAVRITEAKVNIFAGDKETGAILRSSERIREAIPGSALTILPGLYHGEFSINHPKEFAEKLEQFLTCC